MRAGRLAPLVALGLLAAAGPVRAQERPSAEEPLRLVTGDWPPYTGRALEGGGPLTRLVRLCLEEMGRRGEVEFLPFYRAYERTRQGRADASFPFFPDDEREKEMLYSQPLAEVEVVLFHRRATDVAGASRLEDLRGRRFGLVADYAYPPEVKELASANGQQHAYDSELGAFQALMAGEVDVVPAARRVGRRILDDVFGVAGNAVDDLPGEGLRWTRNVHLLVGRGHPRAEALVAEFDGALARLKEHRVPQALLTAALGADTGPVRHLVVRLTGSDSFPVVVGFATHDPTERGVLIPKGTRAVVESWSDRFLDAGPVQVHESMYELSRVKLLEGPLEGHSFWVYNLYIEVEHDD